MTSIFLSLVFSIGMILFSYAAEEKMIVVDRSIVTYKDDETVLIASSSRKTIARMPVEEQTTDITSNVPAYFTEDKK